MSGYDLIPSRPPPHFQPGAGLFSPLALAALLTWASVVSQPWLTLHARNSAVTLPEWLGIAAQCSMLALFLLHVSSGERRRSPLQKASLIYGQLLSALAACALFADPIQPVLLVVVASQAAAAFSRRALLLFLALLNGALATILVVHHPQVPLPRLAATLGAYGGFQLFAVLLAGYARKVEQARDEALRLNAELGATRHLLAEGVRADERLRLSRELHDVAGHKLTALKMQLALFERRAAPELKPALAALHGLADELLGDVRAVVSALRHDEGIDLHAALAALAAAFPQPRIRLQLDASVRVPGVARAEVLLRVAQEALANAARHAGARTVTLSLSDAAGKLQLSVEDDGRGRQLAPEGNGLTGMRERLAAVGGELQLQDLASGGLRLTATLPP